MLFSVKDQPVNHLNPCFYFTTLENAVELFAGKARKKDQGRGVLPVR